MAGATYSSKSTSRTNVLQQHGLSGQQLRDGSCAMLGRMSARFSKRQELHRTDRLVTRAGDEIDATTDRSAPEGDFVRAIVENVGRTSGHAPVVFLKMLDGSDLVLPVFIGEAECSALLKEIKQQTTFRPMTHDLMKNTLELLGYKVTHVNVTDLRDNTFYARICYVSTQDGEEKTVDIDARPSDAINLAVRFQAPIYVSKHVISSSAYLASGGETSKEESDVDEEWLRKVAAQAARRRDPTLELRSRLAVAVSEERYDDAVRIRDQIGQIIGSHSTASLLYDLEQAVAEERFNDAAKIRDELSTIDESAEREAKIVFDEE